MSSYEAEYRRGIAELGDAMIPDASVDAWYLLEYVTELTRASYFVKAKDEMPEAEAETYRDLIAKRANRIPLQYLTGTQEFMGLEFEVSRATLIPRQDTEVLVEEVMKYADGKQILDLCTGTGCIIVSLATLCSLRRAVGTDISEAAIETAMRNAKKHKAEVFFYSGDLFDALPQTEEWFDIIVSNPPYIPSAVIETLMPEVKEHEPMTALDGEADGLAFYRRIICEAGNHLNAGGRVFFEIGCEQAEAVKKLLEESGFSEVVVRKDYAGLDRVVSAVRLSR